MHLFSIAVAFLAFVGSAVAQHASPDVLKELAPTGKLRAAINLGNGVLAQKDPASGQPKGVTPDLSRELARRAGIPVELVTFEAAGKVFEALKGGAVDVVFIAIEPARATDVDFSAAYVLIEGGYMVMKDSALKAIDEVDRKGIRIGVALNSAYDLFLTRTIKNAEVVRARVGGGAAT